MSDAPYDMMSLVDRLTDSIVLENMFPFIMTMLAIIIDMDMCLLYENLHYVKSLKAWNKLWLRLLSSATIGESLLIALQNVRDEGDEDAHNMCQQLGCTEFARHGVVRHYMIAYGIFSKECIMQCWLFTNILQSLFRMLTVDDNAKASESSRT